MVRQSYHVLGKTVEVKLVDVRGLEPLTPCLQSVNYGDWHCVRRSPTKRDWANVSAGFRAFGHHARLLLSDADSCQGVHQIVHQLLSLRKVRNSIRELVSVP